MWKVCVFALAAGIAGCASVPTATDLQFGAEDPHGIFAQVAVYPEQLQAALLPVDLDKQTFGAPLTLKNWDGTLVETATSTARGTGDGFYAMHRLPVGNYAIFGMSTGMSQAGVRALHWLCFTQFAQVVSVKPGEVTIWRIIPTAYGTWADYEVNMHKAEQYANEVDQFAQSTKHLPSFQPVATNVMPKACIDLAGDAPPEPRDCEAKSVEIVHRLQSVAAQ